MSFDSMLNQTATLRRLTNTKDRYNNIEKVYENEAVDIKVRVDMNSSTELELDANSDTVSARLYTRYLDINPHDEFIISGETWRIKGEPIERKTAATFHHYEINIQKVTV